MENYHNHHSPAFAKEITSARYRQRHKLTFKIKIMKKLLLSVIFISIVTGILSADYDNSGAYASYYGTLFLILLFATVGYVNCNKINDYFKK